MSKPLKLHFDEVIIENPFGDAELIIKNATKDVVGFLFNIGDGVTEFRAIPDMTALDQDLIDIAALSAANDDIIQRKGGAWTNRTIAQYKADLVLTKSDVGLALADNTADLDKPISTLTQAGLNLKANIASPTFTGIPAGPTAAPGTNTTQFATTAFVTAAVSAATTGVASFKGRTGTVVPATNDYTWAQIDKTTSSFADLTTRSATDISSGTLADARLSSNVVLLAGTQTLTNKTINGPDNTITNIGLGSLAQGGATSGQVIKWNGSAWAPAADAIGGGITDGDYGDIVVTSTGALLSIKALAVTTAKLAALAVTDAKINDVAWTKITGKPTTISGYGITDGVTLTGSQTLTNKTLVSPVIANGGDLTGDTYYRNASGLFTRLEIGTDGQVLKVVAGLPAWAADATGGGGGGTLADGDYGDVTVTGSGTAINVDSGAITNAKLTSVATNTFKGRITASSGAPEDLTVAQATSMLNLFSSSLKGLVPSSGGGSVNFLRADGSWAAPAVNYVFTASDFNESGSTISIDYANGQAASGSAKGFLTASDWTIFNSKQAALSFSGGLAELSGVVSIASSGVTTVKIADLNVTDAKILSLAWSKITGTPTTVAGYGITDAVTLTGTQTLTNKTLTSPKINVGSDATGDTYYRDASGNLVRLPIGSNGQVLKIASGLPAWGTDSTGGGGDTYTGTTNRIAVTGTVIDIASGYVGQNTLSILGTVATGVWNATAIAASKGGVPAGGTVGQILAKINGTDYNTQWIPAPTLSLVPGDGILIDGENNISIDPTYDFGGVTPGDKVDITVVDSNTYNIKSNAITTAKILDGNVTNAKLASAIDATKLADGSVSNTKLQYINTLSSNAQTQINARKEKQQFLGDIYIRTSWANLSDFTNNGSTSSVSSGAIVFSGGAGTYTQSLDLTPATMLEKFVITGTFTIGSTGGTDYGFGVGVRGINASGIVNSAAHFDMSSGNLNCKVGVDNIVSASPLSVSPGDVIFLTLERNAYTWTATARKAGTSQEITSTFTAGVASLLQNTGRFAIFSFGGSFTLTALSIQSDEVVNAPLMTIGDSKTQYNQYVTLDKRYPTLLSQDYGPVVVSAGGSDKTSEVLARINEIISLHPKAVTLEIGSNDIRFGVSSGTLYSNYDAITAALTAAGIRVFHLLPFWENTAVDQSGLLAHITSTYSASNVIDTYYPTLNDPSSISTDNIHPSVKGNKIVYEQIKRSYKIDDVVPGILATASSGGSSPWTISSTNIYNSNTGNVGIGTSSPGVKLDVLSNVNGAASIRVSNPNAGTAAQSNFAAGNGTYSAAYGMLGTGLSAYGANEANYAYLYADGPGMSFMADNASGIIKLSAGGNTESFRIAKASSINYINMGGTSGASDYGFRNNAGTLEWKNSGGSWAGFGSGGSSQWTDVTMGVQYTNNSNANRGAVVSNNSAGTGAQASWVATNGTNTVSFGMNGTATASYGILAANTAFMYSGQNVAIVSDGGYISFALSGAVEAMRVGSTGVTLNSGSNSYLMPNSRGTSGYVLTTNGAGAATWEAASGGGSSQWVTNTTNTITYTGADNHSGVNVASPATGKAAYYRSASFDGVDVRLQSQPTTGFSGTVSNHPFSILANSTERILLPAAGGVTLSELTGSVTDMVTISAAGVLGRATIPSGGSGMTNPMTTAGDLIVGGSSGTPARLAIGSNGTYLKSNGSAASWSSFTTDVRAQFSAGTGISIASGVISATASNSAFFFGTTTDFTEIDLTGSMTMPTGESGYLEVNVAANNSDNTGHYIRKYTIPYKVTSSTAIVFETHTNIILPYFWGSTDLTGSDSGIASNGSGGLRIPVVGIDTGIAWEVTVLKYKAIWAS